MTRAALVAGSDGALVAVEAVEPGDFSLCCHCGRVLRVAADRRRRLATLADWNELQGQAPDLAERLKAARAAWHRKATQRAGPTEGTDDRSQRPRRP